jgi:hypothetical protein
VDDGIWARKITLWLDVVHSAASRIASEMAAASATSRALVDHWTGTVRDRFHYQKSREKNLKR